LTASRSKDPYLRRRTRKRRYVSPWLLAVLRPFFRRCDFRRAWILRGVGNRIGPVLRLDRRRQQLPLLYEYDRRKTG